MKKIDIPYMEPVNLDDLDGGIISIALRKTYYTSKDDPMLVKLRQYRDDYVLNLPEGEDGTRKYYSQIPWYYKSIVDEVFNEADWKFRALLDRYLPKCLELIDEGTEEANEVCYRELMELVLLLCDMIIEVYNSAR